MDYEHFMKKALKQAEAALAAGEFPVGCVMVYQGKVIASGVRRGTKRDSPNELDHAEMVALRELANLEDTLTPGEITLFSTLEPCLMCFGALIIGGIGKVVFAYEDVMGGGTKCDMTRLNPLYKNSRILIVSNILRNESLKLLKIYYSNPENTYLQDSLLARDALSR